MDKVKREGATGNFCCILFCCFWSSLSRLSFVFHLSGWILVVSFQIKQFCLLFWPPKVHPKDICVDETGFESWFSINTYVKFRWSLIKWSLWTWRGWDLLWLRQETVNYLSNTIIFLFNLTIFSYLSSWWFSSPSLNSSSSTKCPKGSDEIDTILERMRRLSLLAVKTSWSWLWL